MDLFPSSIVHNLIRQGSDHAPLYLVCKSNKKPTIEPFRFLKFQTKHPQFKKVVIKNWNVDFARSPFIEFQVKLKKVKKALSEWSKETFENIFQNIATIEDVIKVKETQVDIMPNASNRPELNKVEAELKISEI